MSCSSKTELCFWFFMLQWYRVMYSPLNSVMPRPLCLCTHHFFCSLKGPFLLSDKDQPILQNLPEVCYIFYVVCLLAPGDQSHSYPLNTPMAYVFLVSASPHPSLQWFMGISSLKARPGLSASGDRAQAHKRRSMNKDLTGLPIKGVSTSSLIFDMAGQERSVLFMLFKNIYAWAKQKEKLAKHYSCFWREDAVYIKFQHILTTTAVTWRSMDVPSVHSNCWVMWIQGGKREGRRLSQGFSEKYKNIFGNMLKVISWVTHCPQVLV